MNHYKDLYNQIIDTKNQNDLKESFNDNKRNNNLKTLENEFSTYKIQCIQVMKKLK